MKKTISILLALFLISAIGVSATERFDSTSDNPMKVTCYHPVLDRKIASTSKNLDVFVNCVMRFTNIAKKESKYFEYVPKQNKDFDEKDIEMAEERILWEMNNKGKAIKQSMNYRGYNTY